MMVTVLSISVLLTACDKGSPNRSKPARKAESSGDQKTKTSDSSKKIDPKNDKASDKTELDKDADTKIDEKEKTESTNGEVSATNILSGEGSSNSKNGTLISNIQNQETITSTTEAGHTNSKSKGIEGNTAQATAKTKTLIADTILNDLQSLLTLLSKDVYKQAWYTIARDKYSQPHNFFEDVATKLLNFGPIISISKDGVIPPIPKEKCDKYRILQTVLSAPPGREISVYDCSTEEKTPILKFLTSDNKWKIESTPQALEFILPHQMGFFATIQYKPTCNGTLYRKEDGNIRIVKVHCKDWGQQLLNSTNKSGKTLKFSHLLYDANATNILEVEAQFIDIDGSNQICQTGVMKREAPKSVDVIYALDEGDGQCLPTNQNSEDPATTRPSAAPPETPAAPASKTSTKPRGRVIKKTVSPTSADEIDPDTGAVLNFTPADSDVAAPPETEENKEVPTNSEESVPEDEMTDVGMQNKKLPKRDETADSVLPIQNNFDSQQTDFSSNAAKENSDNISNIESEQGVKK